MGDGLGSPAQRRQEADRGGHRRGGLAFCGQKERGRWRAFLEGRILNDATTGSTLSGRGAGAPGRPARRRLIPVSGAGQPTEELSGQAVGRERHGVHVFSDEPVRQGGETLERPVGHVGVLLAGQQAETVGRVTSLGSH